MFFTGQAPRSPQAEEENIRKICGAKTHVNGIFLNLSSMRVSEHLSGNPRTFIKLF